MRRVREKISDGENKVRGKEKERKRAKEVESERGDGERMEGAPEHALGPRMGWCGALRGSGRGCEIMG